MGDQQFKDPKSKGHDLEIRVLQKDLSGLYANKPDNLDGKDQVPETHNLPRRRYEQVKTQSRPLTSREMECVIKNLSTTKAQMAPLTGSTEGLEELTPSLLKGFQKTVKEETLAKSF